MLDVLSIGSSVLDVFLVSNAFRVVRDKHLTQRAGFPQHVAECFALGTKINLDEIFVSSGGGASNAAATFARQGFKTLLYTPLDRMPIGAMVREDLAARRIPMVQCFRSGSRHVAGLSVSLLTPDGSQTILVHRGERSALSADDARRIVALKPRWLFVSPGETPERTIRRICQTARHAGIRVALVPSNTLLSIGLFRLKGILREVRALFLNRQEAATLTNMPYEDERRILATLLSATDGIVAVTEGNRGSVVGAGEFLYRAGTFPSRNVKNRTGAGDAFASGFLASVIRSQAKGSGAPKEPVSASVIKEAIRAGTANATSVIEHVGAKTGILSKREFAARRWKNLPVTVSKLA